MSNIQIVNPSIIDSMTEEELAVLWAKNNPTKTFTKFNSVKINNQKLLADGSGINPDFGKIFRVDYEQDSQGEMQEVKTEVPVGTQFFPILQRAQADCDWLPDENGKNKPVYRIAEVNIGADITIKDPVSDDVIATGKYKDLKDQYNLKYRTVLYCHFTDSDRVYRWVLGGQSMSNWFDLVTPRIPTLARIASVTAEQGPTGNFWNNIGWSYTTAFDIRKAMKLQAELMRALRGDAPTPQQPAPAAMVEAPLVATPSVLGGLDEPPSEEGLPF